MYFNCVFCVFVCDKVESFGLLGILCVGFRPTPLIRIGPRNKYEYFVVSSFLEMLDSPSGVKSSNISIVILVS